MKKSQTSSTRLTELEKRTQQLEAERKRLLAENELLERLIQKLRDMK